MAKRIKIDIETSIGGEQVDKEKPDVKFGDAGGDNIFVAGNMDMTKNTTTGDHSGIASKNSSPQEKFGEFFRRLEQEFLRAAEPSQAGAVSHPESTELAAVEPTASVPSFAPDRSDHPKTVFRDLRTLEAKLAKDPCPEPGEVDNLTVRVANMFAKIGPFVSTSIEEVARYGLAVMDQMKKNPALTPLTIPMGILYPWVKALVLRFDAADEEQDSNS